MNKFYILVCILFAYTAHVNAKVLQQKPATPVKPVAAAPKGNPPYVLKKDFDPLMLDLNSKVNNAVSSTAALRHSVADKLEKVIVLDSQMQNVERILNSASFQIALTSDSLKETRFSMEEFKKNTDANVSQLNAANAELKTFLYIFFGAALGLTIILFIVILSMLGSKVKTVKTDFEQQSKEFQMNLSDKMQKHEVALSDDINSAKNRMQYDLNSMKSDITEKMDTDNEAMFAQIAMLTKKITELENSKRG